MSNNEASYVDDDLFTQPYYGYGNASYNMDLLPPPHPSDPGSHYFPTVSGDSTGSKDSGYGSTHFPREFR